MRYAHLIRLSVFSHENGNSEEILEAFLRLFPFSLEENKVKLERTAAAGFNESKIQIFEVVLAKASLINQFLDFVTGSLDENQKQTIIGQSESRLDENLDFFVRFDKDQWVKNGKLELTDAGNCFHLKIGIAAFPKKREIALNAIRELFA